MVRSSLQSGPATDHYHETLGVDATPVADLGGLQVLGPYVYVREEGEIIDRDSDIVIPAGSLILRLIAVIVEDLEDSAENDSLSLKVGGSTGIALNSYDLWGGYPNTSQTVVSPEFGLATDLQEEARDAAVTREEVTVSMSPSGDWHGGQIDIYAVVVTL